ncbi:MAG: fumarylacetoacetate hydrolase family protein [Alphaproteobacteria bacterium]
MKLVRYGPAGGENPGVIDANGGLRNLSGEIADIAGSDLGPATLDRLRAIDPTSLPLVDGDPRLAPPLSGIGKIMGVGLNYADHAAESGEAVPDEPILFAKQITSLNDPNGDIVMPRGATQVDWEAELAVVIGTTARYVDEPDALRHVAGYCVANDVSERDFQSNRGGDWQKGKSCDSFGPLGPWLVTADEVPDPQALRVHLEVNGESMQDGSTSQMIFNVAHLISYISFFMTLSAGDVIITGTPPGVGAGRTPPRFLAPGDVVTVGVEGLGTQRQVVVGPTG